MDILTDKMSIWYNICNYTIRFIVGCIHECTADDRWSPLHTFTKVRCDMKKYIPALCLAVVTVLILLTAASRPYYPITRPYKCPYPVGSDEWLKIRGNGMGIAEPPVDEATASKMSTKSLLLSYVEYPYSYRTSFSRHPRWIFNGMVESSPCLSAALMRDDLIKSLYEIYCDVEINPVDYDNLDLYSRSETDLLTDKIYKLEFICAHLDLKNNEDKYAAPLLAEIERTEAEMDEAGRPFFSHFDFIYITPAYHYVSTQITGGS